MGSPGWFNDNSFRDFPFRTPAAAPTDGVVDIGILLDAPSNFDQTVDTVYLVSITHSDGQLVFTLATTASFASGHRLVFTCPDTDPDYSTYFEDATTTSNDSLACVPYSLWQGFLTIGPRTDLLAALALAGGTLTYSPTDCVVEPALIQDIGQQFVRSLNLANVDRTRTSPAASCSGSTVTPGHVYVNATCLRDNITFSEGYNVSIRQDDSTKTLTINAVSGDGAGPACNEVPLYLGESARSPSVLLEGGQTCGQVLQTINGISGANLQLIAGSGVSITPGAGSNSLIVSVGLVYLAACADGSSNGSLQFSNVSL